MQRLLLSFLVILSRQEEEEVIIIKKILFLRFMMYRGLVTCQSVFLFLPLQNWVLKFSDEMWWQERTTELY